MIIILDRQVFATLILTQVKLSFSPLKISTTNTMKVYHFNEHIVDAQSVTADIKKLPSTATISPNYVIVHRVEITTPSRSPTLHHNTNNEIFASSIVINKRKVIAINFTITVPSQTCPTLFKFAINTKPVFTTLTMTPVNHYVSLVADSYHRRQRLHHLN
jgi:hypothetical protein